MKRLIAPKQKLSSIAVGLALAGMAAVPVAAWAQDKANPVCPNEKAHYNPGNGEDIVVPRGFKVEVFARDLNLPTDIAFVGNKDRFKVYVLESGTACRAGATTRPRSPVSASSMRTIRSRPTSWSSTRTVTRWPARSASRPHRAAASSPTVRRSDSPSSTTSRAGRLFATDSNQASPQRARPGQQQFAHRGGGPSRRNDHDHSSRGCPPAIIRPSRSTSRTTGSTGRRARRPTPASSGATTAAA